MKKRLAIDDEGRLLLLSCRGKAPVAAAVTSDAVWLTIGTLTLRIGRQGDTAAPGLTVAAAHPRGVPMEPIPGAGALDSAAVGRCVFADAGVEADVAIAFKASPLLPVVYVSPLAPGVLFRECGPIGDGEYEGALAFDHLF